MREIKFRAWDMALRKMTEDVTVHETQYRDKNQIYLQYTGLKDKNGKEIYEGDVIAVPYGKTQRHFEVAWDKHQELATFWAYLIKSPNMELKKSDWFSLRLGHSFEVFDVKFDAEVIGNIYENPELIKN